VGLNGDFFEAFQGKGAEAASLDELFERMDKGEFDMVAVGRALLQDPQWATKVKEGRFDELKNYSADALATLY
jgi:2,4-dienoyl-CoA reductase-like NADH-dependent reductase (Old Yellow Enzyme family)